MSLNHLTRGSSARRSRTVWRGRQIADLFSANTHEITGSRIRQRVEELPEMLVGADFFRTHRILVLFEQRKLVFTYSGGPIFQTMEPDVAAQAGGCADTGNFDCNRIISMQ
jgi:hypothetical protein